MIDAAGTNTATHTADTPQLLLEHHLKQLRLTTFNYRNDYVGVEQWSRDIVRGHHVHLVALHDQHQRFAKTWDNNLHLQGFAEVFTDKCIRG
jgi:hypothetical protein